MYLQDYGNGVIMLLREAKEILKNVGYIVEDTDDWDEADMPAGVDKSGRKQFMKAHKAHDNLNDKTWNTGVWVIRIAACPLDEEHVDAVDEQLLGYITADGNVTKKLNDDCLLNYVQCEKLAARYTEYDGSIFANNKYQKYFKQKFHITDKDIYIIIRTGTIIDGKFHYDNLDELDGFTGIDL